jgi:hypothetical protein
MQIKLVSIAMREHLSSTETRVLFRAPRLASNKQLLRSGVDKVLGRGRGDVVLEQVRRARVLKRGWSAAERGC